MGPANYFVASDLFLKVQAQCCRQQLTRCRVIQGHVTLERELNAKQEWGGWGEDIDEVVRREIKG